MKSAETHWALGPVIGRFQGNFLLAIAVGFLPINFALGLTILVPDNYTTIQDGIDASVNGDTILVADGIYVGEGNKDINFDGKAITVCSENGPEATTINCGNSGRGFLFFRGESYDSILEGFTVTNAFCEENGGGIAFSNSSPTINKCNIVENTVGRRQYGGGIDCFQSSPIISFSIISGNTAGAGGGMFIWWYSFPVIFNCLISGNTTVDYRIGGGIGSTTNSEPEIKNCIIIDNNAEYGGGLFLQDSDAIITNCVFSMNYAGEGDGIYCEGYSDPIISNCILWNDGNEEISVFFGNPVVTYSDIEGGWPGEGNIDENPRFVAPFDGNFHLKSISPCIDAGDPTFEVPLGGGSRIDMGAYEYWFGWNILKSRESIEFH